MNYRDNVRNNETCDSILNAIDNMTVPDTMSKTEKVDFIKAWQKTATDEDNNIVDQIICQRNEECIEEVLIKIDSLNKTWKGI